MKSCIIFANGEAPNKRTIDYLKKYGADTIIAADGGANLTYKLGIVPNYVVGDFDSIKTEVKSFYSKKSEIFYYERQDDTDVEKSLKLAISKKFKTAYLIGGTGDRLDHSICNLGIVLKFYSKIRVVVVHGKTILHPYSEDVILNTIPNETISLYAFDNKTTISSIGLKYPLKNSKLQFGKKESTSNVAIGNEVALKIKGGIVFIIRELKVMQKNDFIFKS